MKVKYAAVLVVAAVALFAYGCGGGGDNGTTEEGGGGVASLSEMPSIDAQDYVYSYQAATSLNKAYTAAPGEVGGFSRGGCESDTLKKQLIRRSKFPEMIKCHMGVLETYGNLSIGTDWSVFRISGMQEGGPSEVGEGESFLIRTRKTSAGYYDFDACFAGELANEMRTTSNADGGCTVVFNNIWEVWGGAKLTITLTGACSDTNYTTAAFTEAFSDNQFGYGTATLTAFNATDYNQIEGAFHGSWEGNSFTGKVFSQFDAAAGSAKHNASGTYPAMTINQSCGGDPGCILWHTSQGFAEGDYICYTQISETEWQPTAAPGDNKCIFTDEGTESFTITTDLTTFVQEYKISAGNSAYYDAVSGTDLSGDPQEPTIEFTENWICDDTNAVDINPEVMMAGLGADSAEEAQAAMQVCIQLEQEESNFEEGEICQSIDDTERAKYQE